MIRVVFGAIEDSTVESARNCLHTILFLFNLLNLELATFDLAKIKINKMLNLDSPWSKPISVIAVHVQ